LRKIDRHRAAQAIAALTRGSEKVNAMPRGTITVDDEDLR
jgi:hypothetical protein